MTIMNKNMRIEFIDGLRGFMALCVVYIHYSALFYPTLFLGVYNFSTFVNIFFIISGFVLSYRFWQNKKIEPLTGAALKRYIRLTVAPLVSILIVYALLKLDLIFNVEVCNVTNALDVMKIFLAIEPNFINALYEGLFGMYFNYNQVTSYNPVLWTMSIEFKGSILSLAFLALFGKIKNRLPLYIIFSMISLMTDIVYLEFITGIFLADFIYSEDFKKYHTIFLEKKFCAAILTLLGIFLTFYALESEFAIYQKINFSIFNHVSYNAEIFYHKIAAIMIVVAVFQWNFLRKIFSLKFLTLVGKYSFALYVIHAPLMVSLSAYVFLQIWNGGASLAMCIFVATLVGILSTAAASVLIYKFVDMPAGNLAKRFQKFFE